MRIREATAADIPAMVRLLEQLFSIEEDFEADARRQRSGLAMVLGSPTASLLVAECQGRVVGMVSCQLLISSAQGGWSLLAEDLVVDRPERGRGVGRKLLSAAADWGRLRGAGRMQLLADRSNDQALAFYQSQGVAPTNLICLRRFLN
jgi:ribosomal protein S18 acetylase RimI-like enzyme